MPDQVSRCAPARATRTDGTTDPYAIDAVNVITYFPHISSALSLNYPRSAESAAVGFGHPQEAEDLALQASQIGGEEHRRGSRHYQFVALDILEQVDHTTGRWAAAGTT